MAYTEALKKLMKRVDETRPQRIVQKRGGWEFPKMSLTEKENRLQAFHPLSRTG